MIARSGIDNGKATSGVGNRLTVAASGDKGGYSHPRSNEMLISSPLIHFVRLATHYCTTRTDLQVPKKNNANPVIPSYSIEHNGSHSV